MELEQSTEMVWNAFVNAHASAQLAGPAEFPMDYFTRAVESVLLQGPNWDTPGLDLEPAHWDRDVRESGYLSAQQTVSMMPG